MSKHEQTVDMSNPIRQVKNRKLPPLVFSNKNLTGNTTKMAHGSTNCTKPVTDAAVQNMVIRGK